MSAADIMKLTKLLNDKKISEKEFESIVTQLAKIREMMRENNVKSMKDLEKATTSSESVSLKIKSVEELARMAEKRNQYYHSEDLLSHLPIFKDYPYLVLDTFFSHPNEEEVTFRSVGGYQFSEKLPIALYEFLPGSFSCRLERPLKAMTGGLIQYTNGIYATGDLRDLIEADVVEEIPIDSMPTDFPKEVIKLPPNKQTLLILKPRVEKYMQLPNWWYKTAPGVVVCPSCGRVPDGDEMREEDTFCPECKNVPLIRNHTVPESFAKSWYFVESMPDTERIEAISMKLPEGGFEPDLSLPLPVLARNLFENILFSEKLHITHYYYETQRRYSNRNISVNPLSTYFIYDKRPAALGMKLVTDGFIFDYDDLAINNFVDELVSNPDTLATIKSVLIQFIFHVTRETLKNDLGYFEYSHVFRAIIHSLLDENNLVLPFDLDALRTQILDFLADREKVEGALKLQKPELPENRLKDIAEKTIETSNFEMLSMTAFREFLSTILVHSIAHALLDSLQKISGASEHSSGYFFDLAKKEIYIFDMMSGGSGISETAKEYFYIPFLYRNAIIRQRFGKFDVTPTFLPTRDFLTYFEEYFEECTDYVTTRLLFEIVKKLDFSLLWNLWEDAEKRAQFVGNLVEKHRLLLGEQASFLDFNLRNGTALVLKYLQTELSITNFQDLAALHEDGLLVYQKLKEKLSADTLKRLLRHDEDERQEQELKDLLSLCFASCPTCSLPTNCTYGYFEPTYYSNHRVLRLLYRHLIRNETVETLEENEEEFARQVMNALKEKKVAYIDIKDNERGIETASPFIGYRDGTEFKVKVGEDSEIIYSTTNYRFAQSEPLYEKIEFVEGAIRIPKTLLIKLELS